VNLLFEKHNLTSILCLFALAKLFKILKICKINIIIISFII